MKVNSQKLAEFLDHLLMDDYITPVEADDE